MALGTDSITVLLAIHKQITSGLSVSQFLTNDLALGKTDCNDFNAVAIIQHWHVYSSKPTVW